MFKFNVLSTNTSAKKIALAIICKIFPIIIIYHITDTSVGKAKTVVVLIVFVVKLRLIQH